MKYYLIAGEASGDLQASYLIKEIALLDKDAQFRCFGGQLMEQEGAELVKHYNEMAFMGVEQVLLNLRTIFRNIKSCKEDILKYNPNVLILVDYPGFNLKIAKWSKSNGIKTYYYISPKIWAWNQKRVHKIKRFIDRMFVILPFEKDFYAKFNYEVDFVGHPLLDCIADRKKSDQQEFYRSHNLPSKPIIALLPGSRKQEIVSVLSAMVDIVDKFPNYHFVVGGAPSQTIEFYQPFINDQVSLVSNETYELLEHATAALVVSGTATLETALFRVPQVVCYKTGWLFYQLAKMVIKTNYISLVNLIVDNKIVTELIQHDFSKEKLIKELNHILSDEGRKKMLEDYELLHDRLGGMGASKRAAEKMISYLNN